MSSDAPGVDGNGSNLPPDIEGVRRRVVEFVDQNDLKMVFVDMYNPFQGVDEMLCMEAVTLLRKMDEDKEKLTLVNALVMLVEQTRNESHPSARTYQKVVDCMLIYAKDRDVLPLSLCLIGLVLTADFSLKLGLEADKWEFISRSIDLLDTKGIRSVLKPLTENQLPLIPEKVSSEQRRQLRPVENLLLKILDTAPPIFTMTELSRSKQGLMYIFPRVVERISEIKYYFRPLADLSFVVGRSFMYPILGHPQFNPISSSWCMDSASTNVNRRFAYLPTRKEISSPQNYLFYMVVKQPRGKEALMSILTRSTTPNSPHHNRMLSGCFEGLLSLLISETMAEVEDLEPDVEIPRYQWDHLMTIIIYAMRHQFTTASGVVEVLTAILERRQYRRARDEVMWLMLQIVGSFQANLKKEHVEKLAALYKLLYNDVVSWSCASDHPTKMVRFLSTACMFILLEKTEALCVTPPTESLQNQIAFIKKEAESGPGQNSEMDAILAVLVNAYRSETETVRNALTKFGQRLEGSPDDEPFLLSYKKPANNRLKPFDIQLIDSFAMRAKLHLLQSCSLHLSCGNGNIRVLHRARLPSPATIETYGKMLYTLEFEYGLKNFVTSLQREAQILTSGMVHTHPTNGQTQPMSMQLNPMEQEANKQIMYLTLDMLCNRLTNVTLPSQSRQTIGLVVIQIMHHAVGGRNDQDNNPQNMMGATASSLELHSICEQALMRQFSWAPFSETHSLAHAFLSEDRSVAQHLCIPEKFTNPTSSADTKSFHVCPEVVRMLFISTLRAYKIMGHDISDEDTFFLRMTRIFKWAPSQLQSFPTACKEVYSTMVDDSTGTEMHPDIREAVHSDYVQMLGLRDQFPEYMNKPERKYTIYCVIFRAILDCSHNLGDLQPVFYQILDRMNAHQLILSINWLTDYVIHQCNETSDPMGTIPVLNDMMFRYQFIRFDRMLLSLILHPNNDNKAQMALLIAKSIVESGPVAERINHYTQTVPRKEENPTEFFIQLANYHQRFPEYTFAELMTANPSEHKICPDINPKLHYPNYYGSLIERLLPIVDFTLARALETAMVDTIFSGMLKVLAPIYKYHPSPITYVYSLLHSMHDHFGHLPRARQFVLNIFSTRMEQLTNTFAVYNHQKISLADCASLQPLLTELIERIIECSEFVLQPPRYVAQDWRFCELTPAAQALYLSCIELLASPHNPNLIVPAMVSLLCSSRQAVSRPYTTLNTIALLLTALPEAYGKKLHEMFTQIIESGAPNDLSFDDLVYDNFEENVLLHSTNRPMVINAMMQAYWHHGNHLSVAKFTSYFVDVLYPLINTEKELWYFIRLMLPLQHWMFGKDRSKQSYTECVRQVGLIMQKICELVDAGKKFEHGLELCDMFYHLKYMFTGDSLATEAEQMIAKIPENMRQRMRYYITPAAKGEEEQMGKTSTVVRPDAALLAKTQSDASER